VTSRAASARFKLASESSRRPLDGVTSHAASDGFEPASESFEDAQPADFARRERQI